MIARELVNQMIPPLKIDETGYKAITWMEEFRCNHLPVIDDERTLCGFVSEDIVMDAHNMDKPLDSMPLVGQLCFVNENAHFLDILKIAGQQNLQSVAVLDEAHRYVGVVTILDIMATIAQSASIQMNGGILVLSMDLIDYSLAEIARYVEENDAKIISTSLLEDPLDKDKIKVTLKINQSDLSRIVATLTRFNYRIIGQYQEKEIENVDKDRLELFFKYLNI